MNKIYKILINGYIETIHNHERVRAIQFVKAINRVQFGPKLTTI